MFWFVFGFGGGWFCFSCCCFVFQGNFCIQFDLIPFSFPVVDRQCLVLARQCRKKKIFPSGHSRDMGIRNISLSGISEIALGKGLLRARGASVPFGSSCFGSVQDSVCSLPILDLFWSRKESVPTYNFFSHGLI